MHRLALRVRTPHFALLLALTFAAPARAGGPAEAPRTPPPPPTAPTSQEPSAPRSLAGATAYEGVYRLDGGGRLVVAADGAGGLVVTREADTLVLSGPGSVRDGRLTASLTGGGGLAGAICGATAQVLYVATGPGRLEGAVRIDGGEARREGASRLSDGATPPAPPPADDLRTRCVRAALAARDLGWDGGPPGRQEAYARLLFPHDGDRDRRQFASSMSSCGLFGMAVLREAGHRDACLETPYARQIGRAVSNLVSIGRRNGAWVSAARAPDRLPGPADMVLVGSSLDAAGWGWGEHVLVVVERRVERRADGAEAVVLVSVDGGQAGHSIRERARLLERRGGQLWLRSLGPPATIDRPGAGRRVQGWLDTGALAR